MSIYKSIKRYSAFSLIILFSACIKNDIPYPIVFGEFLSFEVENQLNESVINSELQTVEIELDELADPSNTNVISYSITEDATISPDVSEVINLSDSLVYTITTYQDYVWTIKATQTIERYFKIDQQVGNQIIDAEKLTAQAYIAKGNDLSNVVITDLKLGPPNALYNPDPSAINDFTNDVVIEVSYRDIKENWTLSVDFGDGTPGQDDADFIAFTLQEQVNNSESLIISHTIDHIGGFIDINVNSTNLSSLTINDLEISEGASCDLSANEIIDLSQPKEVIVTAGSGKTKTWLIRAHPATELTNRFFTNWHLDGKIWNPYQSSEQRYWCTGNEGVVTLADSNTVPVEGSEGYEGARLETISLGFLGSVAGTPIAAGNMFIGDFVLNISNPAESVNFARPFKGRPKQLSFQYQYTPEINEEEAEGIPMKKGDLDIGHIWIKVLYVENDTGEFDPLTHLPANSVVIGEGEYEIDTEQSELSNHTIDLNYHMEHLDKTPTHMAIIATSSYYGEFFVGGVGSLLIVKEMNLVY